jgi:hypothetical protein
MDGLKLAIPGAGYPLPGGYDTLASNPLYAEMLRFIMLFG